MIAFVNGVVRIIRSDRVVLDVHGVGYEVYLANALINVKGIGPKTAQTMLSVCSGKEMIEAIENDDIKKLKSLPGIGAKTAGQIVLDLKGKFVSLETSDGATSNPVWGQVQDALLSLGYKTNQLTKIKKELENTELGEDEMLRQALILLAKRNGV